MALALAALAPSALPGPSSLPSDVPSFLLAAAKEEKSQHACGACGGYGGPLCLQELCSGSTCGQEKLTKLLESFGISVSIATCKTADEVQTCVVTGDFNAGNMKIVCKPPDPPVSSMFGGGGGGDGATAKLVMAYVMYGLLNGLITLTQADIDATSKAEPDPPEAMAPDDIARMEAECTIMWQPPLWWDQQPMWMSRPPPWLNDVEVRDDSALLQLGEGAAGEGGRRGRRREGAAGEGAGGGESGVGGVESGVGGGGGNERAGGAVRSESPPPEPAEPTPAAPPSLPPAEHAELAQTLRELREQQRLLGLSHHLVRKLQKLIDRL